MRKLSLALLAASAAFASAASAQTVPDSEPDAGLPKLQLGESAARAMLHPAPAPVREVRREMRREMPRHAAPRRAPHPVAHDMRGPRHPGTRRVEIRRIERGGFIPPMWSGPQFVVVNWGLHGFPRPFAGGRWIRYYDDALLIDRYGRVHEGRYGWNWDRERDRWRDRDGVPVYRGHGDDGYDDHDDEWAERMDHHDGDVVMRHRPPMGDCRASCRPLPPPPPRYGYGYGCGCGPIVVTETITTTSPTVETHTYYEYETVTKRAAPRRHYPKPVRRRAAPAPRPRPGERG